MGISTKVCVPLNTSFELSGKLSTSDINYINIRINQCNSSLNYTSRPCINQTILNGIANAFNGFIANILYINPLINHGNLDYIDY